MTPKNSPPSSLYIPEKYGFFAEPESALAFPSAEQTPARTLSPAAVAAPYFTPKLAPGVTVISPPTQSSIHMYRP